MYDFCSGVNLFVPPGTAGTLALPYCTGLSCTALLPDSSDSPDLQESYEPPAALSVIQITPGRQFPPGAVDKRAQ